MDTTSVACPQASQPEALAKELLWEEECYQAGCAFARQPACQRLQALEERLFGQRPAHWQVEGFRERTRLTRFGAVRVSRRLYRDAQGNYPFLLDQHLGWQQAQGATPSLAEAAVELAAKVPFRPVTATLEKLSAGVLAPATVHRLLERVARKALAAEQGAWEACLAQGKLSALTPKPASRLFIEADGVWVHRQREAQAFYQVKSAVAYTGWPKLPQRQERYKVMGKRFYCHGAEGIPCWEGASLEFARQWDRSRVELVVLGGDGAAWVEEGLSYFPQAVRQRDGFHLARWCRWAVGWEQGQAIYQAIRAGRSQEARPRLAETPVLVGSKAQQARRVLARQRPDGVDWRWPVAQVPAGARGLGTMESQQDKPIANRMKKRGISWSIPGAQRMAKIVQLVINGGLAKWCWGREEPVSHSPEAGKGQQPRRANGEWLQVEVPALWGPHAFRPWVQALRALAHPSSRLN